MSRTDPAGPELARLARLLADDTRATFCLALLDGRAWTASELAAHAGVAASTATGHLNLLVTEGLLAEHRQGRHRYLSLASAEIAELIESLAALAPRRAQRPHSLSGAVRRQSLAAARTCYDHLAGALGVAIADAMTGRGHLDADRGLALTASGADWLAGVGITLPPAARRPVTRACLDWTERRPHVAGSLGAALCEHALATAWITRKPASRAVCVTEAGRRALRDHFAVPDEILASAGPRGSAAS
jgi:DNA-binding transcriptional ArsR family regulator